MAIDPALRRRFRRIDLSWEEQVFLRVLAALGLATWGFVLWVKSFPPAVAEPAAEERVEVAQLLIKPPPPPEEKKPEPKPEPLPPQRKPEEKPGPKPAKVAKAPARAKRPGPAAARPAGTTTAKAKRSVATMGLLSMLSAEKPRDEAPSQRIGEVLRNVDFRQAKDLSEDVGSLTGSVGAREKATIGEMVAGIPSGSTTTKVKLEGSVVTPISGPGGGAEVSGEGGGVSGRTLAEIRAVVASYVPGLKYLYDRELKARPSLAGKVTVEFVVTGGGAVSGVRLVSSGLGHPSLEGAILGRIRNWKFPSKQADATRVTFPFDFLPPAS
ncbi:MAG: periplasmic protein TonB [Candidatus Binatota bacterium]|nr:periplasmic protein TonB [Candidatus Binatota bacterium]